jgi:hypothetical protein
VNFPRSNAVLRTLLLAVTLPFFHLYGQTAVTAPTQLLFVGIAGDASTQYTALMSHGALGPLWPGALKNAGWNDLAFTSWDDLTAEKLQRARCVVLGHSPLRGAMTDKDRAIADLLVSYVEQGGGLLLTHYKDQMYAILDIPMYLAEKFGTQLLIESVHGDPARSWQIGVWWADRYSWTDAVAPLVSNRVGGVLFQSTTDMNTQPGVMPFLPRPPWQVTLDAGPNSHSEPWPVGLEQYDQRAREKGFEKNVPIAGVRKFGRGRVGYIGIYVQPVLARKPTSDNDQQVIRAYLTDGWQGHPSDLIELYLNHLVWLAGHADVLAQTKLALRAVPPPPELPTAWKLHRGLIGPRTTHSTGASTPDEYVARAQKAGLDYMVFLEDFAALKPGAWDKLKADCARLTDATFVAVPGITYENTEGNHGFVFGGYVKLPSKLLLDDAGQRLLPRVRGHPDWFTELHWLYGLQGFQNHSGWYWFSKNPYPPLDVRNCDCFAVLTQQNGRTVDRAFESHALNTRNGQYLRPVALTLMRSADEINFVERGVYAHDVLGAHGLKGVADWFTAKAYETRSGRHLYPDCPPSGMQGVSSGPWIELKMDRGDTDAGATSTIRCCNTGRWS